MLVLYKRSRNKTLQDKVDNFKISIPIEDRVIAAFGNPEAYFGSNKTYSKTNLPSMFVMTYPDDFSVAIMSERIHELRFRQPNYAFNGIRVGTSLEDVVAKYPPRKIVTTRQPNADGRVEKGTLYKNFSIEGTASYDTGTGLRLFFGEGKVERLSLYDPNWPRSAEL